MKRKVSILLAIELAIIVLSLIFANPCGSGCGSDYSLLNPFGIELDNSSLNAACPAVCKFEPYPTFWIATDALIITVAILGFFIVNNRRRNKNS